MSADGGPLYDRVFWPRPLAIVAVTGWCVLALAITVVAGSWSGVPLVALVLTAAGLQVPMRVKVTGHDLDITWGPTDLFSRGYRLSQLVEYRAVRYDPWLTWRGEPWTRCRTRPLGPRAILCYSMRGNRGVLFAFRGDRFIVGVDDPQELLQAVESATGVGPAEALERLGRRELFDTG